METKSQITYGDIYQEFLDTTDINKDFINEYRPCEPLYDVPYIPMAIVIWLENQSKIIYISKYQKQEMEKYGRNN